MSFRNMDLWMERTDCLDGGEMAYNASARIGSKRANQWLIDNAEAGLFPNKRQAVGILYNNTVQEAGSRNVSIWENASNVEPDCSQFSGKIRGSPSSGEVDVDEESIPSPRIESMNMHAGRKLIEDTFGLDSQFSLSMSHAVGDLQQSFNYSGLRKVKVSEVKDCENESVLEGHPYDTGCKSAISLHSYSKENHTTIPTALSYPEGNSHIFSVGGSASREGSGFMLMNLQYSKQGANFAIGEAYSAEDGNVSMADLRKGNSNTISVSPKFTKDNSTGTCVGVDYKKDDNIFSLAEASLSLSNAHNRTFSLDHSRDNNLAVGHNGESNIISFGGFHDDEANFSGRNICNYDMFFDQTKQPSAKKAEVHNNMNPTDLERHANVAVDQHETVSVNEYSLKKQDQKKLAKKLAQNNFPSNVRSLLSTGMLDGVPVKYIAWSREKELRAVIKGSGYLCGCEACNFTKVINAYEFERHAGCKTKHPNNHIYFENGKTIYGIVQELRSTSQDLLFDVIQTITGSPLNQKSFRLWKESFLAATRELQRIYGKDE